jgi:hypothetical protein
MHPTISKLLAPTFVGSFLVTDNQALALGRGQPSFVLAVMLGFPYLVLLWALWCEHLLLSVDLNKPADGDFPGGWIHIGHHLGG